MSFCTRCGSASRSSRSAFCTRCGASLNAKFPRSSWKSLPFVARLSIYLLCSSALFLVLMWHRRLVGLAQDFDYLFPYEVVSVAVLVAALFFLMLDRIAKRAPK